MSLEIYLARHGQTDWNRRGKLQGWTDIPLNARGIWQALHLMRRLEAVDIDHVYCSALGRSLATAAMLAERAPVTALVGLNERRLGDFEGKNLLDDPGLLDAYRRRRADPDDDLGGGESLREHYARASRAVEAIRGRHPRGTVVIVGHGGTNAQVLRNLAGLSSAAASAIRQRNDQVFHVRCAEATFHDMDEGDG